MTLLEQLESIKNNISLKAYESSLDLIDEEFSDSQYMNVSIGLDSNLVRFSAEYEEEYLYFDVNQEGLIHMYDSSLIDWISNTLEEEILKGILNQ